MRPPPEPLALDPSGPAGNRVLDAVRARPVLAVWFGTVMFKAGYAVNQVDEFLTEMAGVLERYRIG